jgi:glyoxylase-like metal-dependent hydrolase (beta-lactamase superfamily II)
MSVLALVLAAVLDSNHQAITAVERAVEAHGSEKDLKLTLTIRGDRIAEGQSVVAMPPFETYPFFVELRIDQPAGRALVESRQSISGDFHFADIVALQGGKGFGLTPELKVYRDVTGEAPLLGRYFPHRVLMQALRNRPSLRALGDHKFSFATTNGQFLTIDLDPQSNLLRRIEQVGGGLYGDGTRETLFEEYAKVGALMLPKRMRTRTHNAVHGTVENVYRYDAKAEVTIDPKSLELPAGYTKGDWSYRGQFVRRELAKDVYLLENITKTTGQWSYNVLAVVFDEFVLVAEAPVASSTTEEVLAHLRELAPGKPVRYVVQSHHHDDHIGGIRPYIADGTTIVTTATVKPLLEKIVAAPNRLDPDRLARSPKAPVIEVVTTTRTIRDANHEVVIHNLGPHPHARDILIVHLPKERILYQSDMINEGEYPENAGTRDFAAKVKSLGLQYDRVVGLHGR